MQPFVLGLTLLAILQQAFAHTVFTTLFVNDVNQGDGTCIRMPKTPSNATYPVLNAQSWDMACGKQGESTNEESC
jgi:hypothetical protein